MTAAVGDGKGKGKSELSVDAVREVRRGAQSEVFLTRAGLLDPSCCLSVHTSERSLDLLLASSRLRDAVIRGLRALLEERALNNGVKFI